MSSIVLYKGSELTRISNTTKTLTTAGTWLEDDIEITDQTVLGIYTTEETDLDGYPIGILTAVDLSYDTVLAEHLEYGYTAHDYLGRVVTGSLVPGSSASGTISITQNGTYDVTDYASASVSVTAGDVTLQAKTNIDPTTSSQTIGPDIGYDGLSSVQINAISPDFIGSNVPRKGSNDLSVSGATVTVPAGLYESSVSASAQSGTAGTPTATKGTVSNHSINVTPSVTNTEGYISGGTISGTDVSVSASELVSGNKNITSNGTNIDVANYSTVSVSVSGQSVSLQSKTNIDPTTSSQTIEPDDGYDGLSSVQINAMPSMTLPTSVSSSGSGTTKATVSRSTSDQYINIPTGYNGSAANYKISAVANGTAGTPTASKGTVSNNSITVTPSVTNTTGYITGGTKTGTGVSVTASELVSGNKEITSVGSGIDVTNYATASVSLTSMTLPSSPSSTSSGTSKATISRSSSTRYLNIPQGYNDTAQYYTIAAVSDGTAGTPTASKGTVSNHSISVTPSVTNTTGFISGGTITGTAVSVSASELVSGNKEITDNGTNIDVTNYATVSVALEFATIYSGSSAPSAATGSNGDIYIQS